MTNVIISLALSALLALPVGAQVPAGVRDEVKNARENIRVQRQEAKEALKSRLDAAREELKNKTEEARTQFEVKREQFKQEFEMKREEVRKMMEAEKAALKDRLAKIKDEKKRQAVERIANQIAELNTRRLDHFSAVLEKLEKALERIVSRIEKAAARGLDVSSPKAEVEKAKTAIVAARAAINAQAGKVYTVLTPTSTESGLKREVGNVRQLLHADLKKVEEAVRAARDAVRKVATTLAQVRGIDEEPSPAGGPTPTPTSTATTTNP
jgi:DNA repair exonuclease SbcCD ATPase subunit